LPKLLQSFATNIAVFVANDVAARAAKTAGVNRKSYVIQTPLTMRGSSLRACHSASRLADIA
jgi:hypothetical protein